MPIHDVAQPTLFVSPSETEDAAALARRQARIRAEVNAMITELLGAASLPWSEQTMRVNRLWVANSTKWLAPDEGEDLRQRFQQALQSCLR